MTAHHTQVPVIVEVAVALPVFGTFTYRAPEGLSGTVACGKRILVPFGKRRVTGYVLGEARHPEEMQIKDLLDVLDDTPLFTDAMLPFFRWISDYYFHPIGMVIKNALPGGLNLYDVFFLEIATDGRRAIGDGHLTPLEREVLTVLDSGACRPRELRRRISRDIPRATIVSLFRKGYIKQRRPLKGATTKARLERFLLFQRLPTPEDKLSELNQHIMDTVGRHREIAVSRLKKAFPQAPGRIATLEKKGLLSVIRRRVYRDPMGEAVSPDRPPELTGEQQTAVATVLAAMERGFSVHLLAGVTGSGKTEVYLRLAAAAVERGLSVIVLVPEIALITQMAYRFRARFGAGVAVLHSGLSAGERYDQWQRMTQGQVNIAIGARSAVFAPLAHIGLIVVDEEHDGSYKQDSGLRYNARDLAVVRARQNNAVALLGSATPSVQSLHNVTVGKFKGLTLTRRVLQRPLPEITVVDLKETDAVRGSGRYISLELYRAMKASLARKEQVLLFLNRRGYATYPVCGACGESLRCKNCDIPMTLHLKANAYRCHYCGFTRPAAARCPRCGSTRIKRLGLGTEKLQDTISELFPAAMVARMDRDATVRKGAMLKILKGLRQRTIDILIGTQMVTKGHDFPNITLVGIVCADLSLNVPDFRAAERTYQLIAQVAGRAGRGEIPGRVILQTYNPEHFSVRSAGAQDAEAFYSQEIGFRKALNYPPFSRIVQLRISGRDKAKTAAQAETVGDLCRELKAGSGLYRQWVEVLGPIEAPMPKIAGRYRWQILLKGSALKPFREFVRHLVVGHAAVCNGPGTRFSVDVDPYFMT